MSSFTTELDVRILNKTEKGRQLVRVLAPFDYYTDLFDSRFVIEVPPNFVTDFASVPRALWAFYPPLGPYGKAAVVHDYLCKNKHIMSSSDAHKVFREAMIVLGNPKRDVFNIYNAVRMFGPKFKKETKK